MRVAAFTIAAVVAAGCFRLPAVEVGTQLGEDEALEARSNLAKLVVTEIENGDRARAFYALELYKTRAYAAQRLSALPYPGRPDIGSHADLRPMFRQMYAESSDTDTRGLLVVKSAAGAATATHREAMERLFWDDFRLLRKRQKIDVFNIGHRFSYAITTLEQSRRLLAPRQALASYFIDGDKVYLFWLADSELAIHPLPATASQLRSAAARLLSTLRTPPQLRASGADWRVDAITLYTGLFEPVADRIAAGDFDVVYASPDRFIANVPFDVLLDGEIPLIQRVRVARAPSASVLKKLAQRSDREIRRPRILSVGNPIYPDGVPDLPFAAKEAEVVSEVFDAPIHLFGRTATETSVLDAIGDANVLHFATHAVLLGQMAPDASSLLLSANDSNDGFLSAAEIVGLDLEHVGLVVLSACQTSVSKDEGGSLDLGSLSGAFLGAGAENVVGTLWQVADESTTRLMIAMYGNLLQLGSGDALRRAKLAMLRSSRFSDPFYWAAFVLYGWGL